MYPASNSTPGFDNVSNNGTTLSAQSERSLALDSNGFPNVAWADSTSGDIFFAKWNGSNWVDAAGNAYCTGCPGTPVYGALVNVSSNSGDSIYPSLQLNGSGVPHIAWADDDADPGNHDILFRRFDAAANAGAGGWANAAGVLGTTGNSTVVASLDDSIEPSLDLVSGAEPAVAWHELSTNNNVHYSRWVGGVFGWIPEAGGASATAANSVIVDSLLGAGPPSLQMLSFAFPVITWSEEISGSNRDVVAYRGLDTGCGPCFVNMAGTGTTIADATVLANAGTSLAPVTQNVGSSSNISFAWSDDTTGDTQLHFATWATSSFVNVSGVAATTANTQVTAVSGPVEASTPSLVLTSAGYPALAWFQGTILGGDVYYTTWNGSAWVEPNGSSGMANLTGTGSASTPSLQLQVTETPAIAFLDDAGVNMMYGHWITPYVSPRVGQSLSVDATSASITSATLAASQTTPTGTAITYALSNDGANFSPVTPGVPLTFTTAGSDLRWRATLSTASDLGVTPSIESLSIDYVEEAPAQSPTDQPLVRLSGNNRVLTAIDISQDGFPTAGSASALAIATSQDFPDGLAAGPLAATVKGPLLINPKTLLSPDVAAEITRVFDSQPDPSPDVYVVGGTSALSQAVEDGIRALDPDIQTQRVAGPNRISTAVAVADTIDVLRGKGPSAAVLANAQNFPDALAASAPATSTTVNADLMPILLTNPTTLATEVATYLQDSASTLKTVSVVGGTSAISDAVRNAADAIIDVVNRYAGSNRFGTAAAIAVAFFSGSGTPTTIGVANGEAFPDALTGGRHSGLKNEPLLLVRPTVLPTETANYVSADAGTIFGGFVYGGASAVSDAVKAAIEALY